MGKVLLLKKNKILASLLVLLLATFYSWGQQLHLTPSGANGTFTWSQSPNNTTTFDWPDGTTAQTYNNVDGTGVNFVMAFSGETEDLTPWFNTSNTTVSVNTDAVTSSYPANGESLEFMTNGFEGAGLTYTINFSASVYSIGFDLLNINGANGFGGDHYVVTAQDALGNTIYPTFTTAVNAGYTTNQATGTVDSDNGGSGQEVQLGVNFEDIDGITSVTVVWTNCNTCVTSGVHGGGISGFNFSTIDPCDAVASGNLDSDNDGISDICDLDDDNDGILDLIENPEQCLATNLNYSFSGVLDGARDRGAPNDLNRDFIFGDDFSFLLDFNDNTAVIIETTIGDNNSGRNGNVTVDGVTLPFSTTAGSFQTLSFAPSISSSYSINYVGNDVTVTSVVVKDVFGTVLAQFDFGHNSSPVATSYIGVTTDNSASTSPSGNVVITCSITDSDNDGIPNYLDLDSDGDGCPDALESTSSPYTYPNLNADGSIDTSQYPVDTSSTSTTYGVPASTSYTEGTSTDFTIQSTLCSPCHPDHPDFSDADGDTIGDICDLDDDNDGILDVDELAGACTSSEIVRPLSVTGMDSNDVFGGMGVESVADGLLTTFIVNSTADGYDTMVFDLDNAYKVEELVIYNNAGGNFTDNQSIESIDSIEFYDTLGNLVLSFSNVVIPEGTAGDPFEIAIPPATTNNAITKMVWNGVNARVNGIAFREVELKVCIVDTDNDGIPNHLDLDSDGDGCPDAIEGAGTYTQSNLVASSMDGGNTGGSYTGTAGSVIQNLGNTVNTNGIPTIVTGGDTSGTETSGQATTAAVTDGSDSTACTVDLSLTKVVDNALPKVGDEITYTITITNSGPLNATGVNVTDMLPTGLTYKSSSGDGSYDDGTDLWTIGDVNVGVGSSKSIEIKATVNTAGTSVNTAVIQQSNQSDIDSSNDGN